ncbi:glycosyltransferase family 2 protein [Microbacterium jejuense]|uniref:glycosyltransferase family 2 protein n=1 Tax=Microbacterium jejuense TaxID=1263637 RepID=UPI0031E6E604
MMPDDERGDTARAGEGRSEGRFVGPGDHADVAVVVVTYRSAADLGALIDSLRREAVAHRLRVVVADNDSPDDTLEVARAHSDVVALPTGGNLGYAGGINAAMGVVGDADAILILNPDLVVHAGAIAALRERAGRPGVGLAAPVIVDGTGDRTPSLRREPSVLRSLCDALVGDRLRRRPASLTEMVLQPAEYAVAHPVDWATGAALLVSREAATAIGEWDERFFLYSEETDYCRRARDAGIQVWFEPTAVVRHSEGGSGASVALAALLAVNRIRYYAKYHGPAATLLFHATAVLNELTRAADPAHRAILRTVLSPGSWSSLPHATSRAAAAPGAAARAERASNP